MDEPRVWSESTYARLKKGSCFDLNICLVVGKQHMGCGERVAAVLAGMLDLAVSPMEMAWRLGAKLNKKVALTRSNWEANC